MNHNLKKAMTALMLSALIVSSFSAVTAGANDTRTVNLISQSDSSTTSTEEADSTSSDEDDESSTSADTGSTSSSDTVSTSTSTSSGEEEEEEEEIPAEGITTEEELRAAIANPEGEITLGGSIVLEAPLSIEKAVTINGAGHMLSAGYSQQESIVTLMPGATGSVLKDITITANETSKHTLNIWKAGEVTLENVALNHASAATGAPLTINNSDVTIKGSFTMITGVNSWYGINLDDRYGETKLTFDSSAEITFTDVFNNELLWCDESQSQITVNNPEVAGLVYSETVGQYLLASAKIDVTEYATLQDAINAASAEDTITLTRNAVVYNTITIDKNLTIDGAGFQLIASESSGSFPAAVRAAGQNLMNITGGAEVTLKGVQLMAGSLNQDVLYVEQGGSVVLEDVTLDHTSAAGGAALTIESADVTVSGGLTIVTGENSERGILIDSKTNDSPATLTFSEGCDFQHTGNEGIAAVELELSDTQTAEDAVVNPENAGLEIDESGQVVPVPGEDDSDDEGEGDTDGDEEQPDEEQPDEEKPELPVASVTVGGVVFGKYDTLQEALNYAPSGATITVSQNGLRAVVGGNRIFTIVLAGDATEYPTLTPAAGYMLLNLGGGQYYVYQAPSTPEEPDAEPLHGWVKRGSRWYLYNNGKKLTGWQKQKNVWYYMDSKGVMLDNGLNEIDGVTYYFHDWGGMANSWWRKDANGDWYYFRGNGAMAKSSWIEWKGEYYYVGKDGKMLTNTTTPDGYRVDRDGKWIR